MPTISAVLGDITAQSVDAIINAANPALRGGGGGDGAIHRAGGPAILADCIARFPHGLAIGDAGWTTAGRLPARWVIHTVGPNFAAGQRDRRQLESCYRRALAVADELDARTIAFPLVSAGAYGWPLEDAVSAAVETIAATPTLADEVRIVARDQRTYEAVRAVLTRWTPFRILQGIQVLHQRGYDRVRAFPGVSPSGMYWRVTITTNDGDPGQQPTLRYSTGDLTQFADGDVSVATSPDTVADLLLEALPGLSATRDDPDYVAWFSELMSIVARIGRLPVAYADNFDDTEGWEIGWGSGLRHPLPPEAPASGSL